MCVCVCVCCRGLEDVDDEYDEGNDLAMEIDPDHPALARVQEALKKQITAQKQRLEEEMRQKVNCRPLG